MAPGDCCIPPPPAEYQASGVEEKWEELDVYASGARASSSAVLFICDIYGWEVPQTRHLADKMAAQGHFVLVPDFMDKDYFDSPNPDNPYEGLHEYLLKHPEEVAIVRAARVIEQVRSKGFKKVGVVGNCRGAKIAISLLRGDKGVDAAVMNHPSFLLPEEVNAVTVPLAILAAEQDNITPPAMALEFAQILAKSPVVGDKAYVKIYMGVDHGWTTRYDLKDESACVKACEAHEEALAFLAKYLV